MKLGGFCTQEKKHDTLKKKLDTSILRCGIVFLIITFFLFIGFPPEQQAPPCFPFAQGGFLWFKGFYKRQHTF